MRKSGFWKSDWFLGLLVTLAMLAASSTALLQSLERKAYDMGVQASSHPASDAIAVIAIDDQSIANLGRWPWPRDLHAKMIDLLAGAKARTVASTIGYFEPQIDPGYAYVVKLLKLHGEASAAMQQAVATAQASPGKRPSPPPPSVEVATQEMERIGSLLQEAEAALNTDRKLSESIEKAGNVLVPMMFQLGEARGRSDKPLPEFIARNRVPQASRDGNAVPAAAAYVPIEDIGGKAAGVGHLNTSPDVDGGVRTDLVVVAFYDQLFPSLSLLIAAKSLNLGPADIRVRLGEEVRVGKLRIPTDLDTRMYTFFYKDQGGRPAFQVDSFYDVMSGKIPASKYQGKIVLIGATALGIGQTQVTPLSPNMPAVLSIAHSVSSILKEHFFTAPVWGVWAQVGAYLVTGLYLILLLPRLSAGAGAVATALLVAILVGTHFGLMVSAGLWLQFMGAASLVLVGHLLLTTKRFLVTERGKLKSDMESAESNRMLGLAFQGQGQLDMAFDKFRKCPLDDQLMENLYNLALDYERKRQFNKAESVFRYMAEYNPNFRDLKTRTQRAKQMSDTVILGGTRGQTAGGTLILDQGQVEKPMLGRYQVEKELGKGAMGVVYLGRDPKINRVVAIKTMALSQEFDDDELVEVKARFFREAESAGRLNHPNIVTIFDAGEEQDLAYIAMEFLKGKDLVPCTKPESLLPLPKAIGIVARVADALDYAHKNNVVHRDIKPGNIMYEPQSDQVKVTDFGIARITDSSKTKTGMVLGTPSYMSPEQLAGKKIDGRSDLFSLGVTLYQLASGALPFAGEALAQLMYKIANEDAPDIRSANPQAPAALAMVIARALAKDPTQRYQTGEELAKDLRACMETA